jgi:hypothetical protein
VTRSVSREEISSIVLERILWQSAEILPPAENLHSDLQRSIHRLPKLHLAPVRPETSVSTYRHVLLLVTRAWTVRRSVDHVPLPEADSHANVQHVSELRSYWVLVTCGMRCVPVSTGQCHTWRACPRTRLLGHGGRLQEGYVCCRSDEVAKNSSRHTVWP